MTSEKTLARIAGSLNLSVAVFGIFPKVLGVVLAVGCFGYLVELVAHFLAPDIAESIAPVVLAPAAVGELSFVAWLLVKTVGVPEREAPVPALA